MENITHFAIWLLPISCVNNLMKYALMELQLRFRKRLTDHLMTEYGAPCDIFCLTGAGTCRATRTTRCPTWTTASRMLTSC